MERFLGGGVKWVIGVVLVCALLVLIYSLFGDLESDLESRAVLRGRLMAQHLGEQAVGVAGRMAEGGDRWRCGAVDRAAWAAAMGSFVFEARVEVAGEGRVWGFRGDFRQDAAGAVVYGEEVGGGERRVVGGEAGRVLADALVADVDQLLALSGGLMEVDGRLVGGRERGAGEIRCGEARGGDGSGWWEGMGMRVKVLEIEAQVEREGALVMGRGLKAVLGGDGGERWMVDLSQRVARGGGETKGASEGAVLLEGEGGWDGVRKVLGAVLAWRLGSAGR